MKNISILSTILSVGLVLVGCSKSDNEVQMPKTDFNIVSAENVLPVSGGQIHVTTDLPPAQAYAEDSWLKVTLEGNKVTLSAVLNEGVQSRNTSLILKDAKGDSTLINIKQAGIIFGLPKTETFAGGDEAINKTLILATNVKTDYSSTVDWITVKLDGNKLQISAPRNETGKPRIGYVIARTGSLEDKIRVVQASLADVAGSYIQTAQTLMDSVTMGETVNEVSIERVSDTKAKFIVDGIFTWNIDFTPGRGFTMLNGQVVGESTNELGNKVYIATVLAADDFTPEHKNTLVGSREPVHLNIADDGSLVFTQAQLIAPGQTWASYAFARSNAKQITLGSSAGLEMAFIRPKLQRAE